MARLAMLRPLAVDGAASAALRLTEQLIEQPKIAAEQVIARVAAARHLLRPLVKRGLAHDAAGRAQQI